MQRVPVIIAAGWFVVTLGLGSLAHAQLPPFPGEKTLVYPPDPIVGIGKDASTEFIFRITLDPNFDPNVSVMDVVPAEFDVMSATPSCGTVEYTEDGGSGRAGGYKLAPDFILWDLYGCPSSSAQSLTVMIKTDLNPGHAKRGIDFYEPTSCGPLFLNDGARFVVGEDDDVATEPSNALVVAACPDESDLLCVDADQDGLSVACGDIDECQPTEEVCDGLDNDCDGFFDEGLLCEPGEDPQ